MQCQYTAEREITLVHWSKQTFPLGYVDNRYGSLVKDLETNQKDLEYDLSFPHHEWKSV